MGEVMLFSSASIHGLVVTRDASPREFFEDTDSLLSVDGVKEIVPIGDDGKYTLKQLQVAVGGYIELLPIEGGTVVIVMDEDGTLKKDPQVNPVASMLAGRPIVGDVCVLDPKDFD
jgi:hypothetical protein